MLNFFRKYPVIYAALFCVTTLVVFLAFIISVAAQLYMAAAILAPISISVQLSGLWFYKNRIFNYNQERKSPD